MKLSLITVAIVLLAFGASMLRVGDLPVGQSETTPASIESGLKSPAQSNSSFALRASGIIEGRTETIDLRARIAEQIVSVHVIEGAKVAEGEVLISLDSERLIQQRDLAQAQLEMANAKKLRLTNGARNSEIETAKQEYEAWLAPLWNAERALERGKRLIESQAISQNEMDTLIANVESSRGKAAAAKARLDTLQLPARADELSAAVADVRAAEASLKIAEINLKRSLVLAPISGTILNVDARVGELTGPDVLEPLVVIADTSQLHAIAEVDEFDALSVQLGQSCEVTSDANEGVLATGRVVEVEPRMQPKKTFGQWAGERNDTFSRRVKVVLDEDLNLPIGLPVEVAIKTSKN